MSEKVQIPLVNLKAQYESIKNEVHCAIEEVLSSQSFVNASKVRQFEKEMCKHFGSPHAVGCSNGTSAIYLALEAWNIGRDDEVLTTPFTFIATAEAISQLGARPVFVDINPQTYQIDAEKIETSISEKTKAILPVHLYGNASDMESILRLAKKVGLFVLEDCAQSHLAKFDGKFLGTFGDAASFSFYPAKNLGAYGDAGMIFVKEEAKAAHIRKMMDHGRMTKYEHDIVGSNYRMDELQAAILSVKLTHLSRWTERRRSIAKRYDEVFKKAGFKTIVETKNSECVYHQYVVEVSNRHETVEALTAAGISTGIHFPTPLHLQKAYAHLGHQKGDFPHTERASTRVLSLPICPELRDENVLYIAETFIGCARP